MPEPCVSCDRREIDFGGCRCQACLLTGDARNADPVCALSPFHGTVEAIAARQSGLEVLGFDARTRAYTARFFDSTGTSGTLRATPGRSVRRNPRQSTIHRGIR